MPTPPCILTIAGSDSGGGAGIQADLKTITVIGGFGMSVITALTAQNGVGVAGIHAPEPGFVGLQLKTVREGFPIAAAKTGMLFSAEIIEAVEAGLQGREFPLVVDPVCVSQSGQRLLREDAVNALRWHILPKADLLTPNRPEAELLADMKIDSEKDIDVAARKLLDMGPKAVLIKGGHFGSASDAVAPGTPVLVFSFFRRVACPAFSGDSVSGIRAFYRLRERRLAFHANMFYLFLL